MNQLFNLHGKVAVVTGGTSGLGLGFARGIARQGGSLALWGRNADKCRAAKAELEQFGGPVLASQVNVASEAEVVRGFAEVMGTWGRVDCVIANAGISNPAASIFELTAEMYDEMLAIGQHGVFYTLREGARHMVARAKGGEPGGSLIACGSLALFRGMPGMEHYAAAKAAAQCYVRGLAVELGPYGIRANVIAAGYVKTELQRDYDEARSRSREEFFAAKTPLLRIGAPEDFEGIAAYFASDASRFHSGDTVVVDGGFMMKM